MLSSSKEAGIKVTPVYVSDLSFPPGSRKPVSVFFLVLAIVHLQDSNEISSGLFPRGNQAASDSGC